MIKTRAPLVKSKAGSRFDFLVSPLQGQTLEEYRTPPEPREISVSIVESCIVENLRALISR